MSDAPKEPTSPEQESVTGALREMVTEAVGAERGLVDTLVALRERPADVVDEYLTRRGTYVSPYRVLVFTAASWAFVMNVLFDWSSLLQAWLAWVVGLFGESVPASTLEAVGDLGGAFLSTYIIPLIAVMYVLHAGLWTRLTRRLGLPFRRHLAVMAYRGALSTLIGFVAMVGMAIHVVGTLVMIVLLTAAELLGVKLASKVVSVVPVEAFYRQDADQVGRAYRRAGLFLMSALVVLSYAAGAFIGLPSGP